jgi:membrane protease YdiL (CAAX protease family)
LAVVILDIVEIRYPLGFGSPLLALCGLLGVLCVNNCDGSLLGLRSSPIDGWWKWCRLGFIFFLAIAALLAMFAGIWGMFGWKIPIYRTSPSLHALIWMCVYAPVVEETIYRSLISVALIPSIGEWGTIIVSGVVFAGIHVGLILAWAFIRSGTILVPIALHSGGNFFALAGQIANWYWMPLDG